MIIVWWFLLCHIRPTINHFPLKFGETITKHSNLGSNDGLGDLDCASTTIVGVFIPYFSEIILV
jgi:hypothetical protein